MSHRASIFNSSFCVLRSSFSKGGFNVSTIIKNHNGDSRDPVTACGFRMHKRAGHKQQFDGDAKPDSECEHRRDGERERECERDSVCRFDSTDSQPRAGTLHDEDGHQRTDERG